MVRPTRAACRTIPRPQSTRYRLPSTTTAVEIPLRRPRTDGPAAVPRVTTCIPVCGMLVARPAGRCSEVVGGGEVVVTGFRP
jgi:hypothetical protein